jgi:hypothetical protein
MVRLTHDSGRPATVKCEQALGDDSPLEFDEDGVAYVDDEDAADLDETLTAHVRVEPAAPEPSDGEDEAEEADAEVESEPADESESSSEEVDVPVDVPEEFKEDVHGAEGTLPFDPSAFNLEELEEELATVDDPAAVYALATIETTDGDARKGAYERIEARLKEIAEADGD